VQKETGFMEMIDSGKGVSCVKYCHGRQFKIKPAPKACRYPLLESRQALSAEACKAAAISINQTSL
jgi:hypothetical protein